MTKVPNACLWTILIAVLAAPFIYLATAVPDPAFLGNVMSGLLATAAALVGGIPLALMIDRIVKKREEQSRQAMERKRELELLELIKEELAFSSSGLIQRQASPQTLYTQPLKSDLWAAVTAAGKLNLIQSHRLLNRITSAYYVLNMVRRMEEEAYRSSRTATVTFGNGMTATQLVLADARRFDQLLADSIREAIREIDEERVKAA